MNRVPKENKKNQNKSTFLGVDSAKLRKKAVSSYGLLALPPIVGTIFGLIWVQIKPIVSSMVGKHNSEILNFFVFGVVLLIWSISGIIIIWRKEIPVVFSIFARGKVAVAIGILIMAFCWWMATLGFKKGIELILLR
jgi:hypothetical protein